MTLLCSYFEDNRCRSCTLLPHGEGAPQLKYNNLIRLFKQELPKFDITRIKALTEPSAPFSSRAKVKMNVTGTFDEPIIGLLSADLVGTELLDCPLHLNPLNHLLHYLKGKITTEKLHPYDPKKRMGELKGIILMSNRECTEIIVRFILRTRDLEKRITRIASDIQGEFPQVKVVSINIQPVHHAILEGEEEIVVTSDKVIWEKLNNVSIAYGPKSFMQVSPEVAGKLYGEAKNKLLEKGVKEVTELFSGAGGFLLTAASSGIRGNGLEVSEDAVFSAREAAFKNSFSNLVFERCDLLQKIPLEKISKEAVIVNPPRRGVGKEVLQALLEVQPRIIVYSSCNPETFCSDMKAMEDSYTLEAVTPFDMFPLTEHLEVLCMLSRKQ